MNPVDSRYLTAIALGFLLADEGSGEELLLRTAWITACERLAVAEEERRLILARCQAAVFAMVNDGAAGSETVN